jgi:EmrB/QacA subfamily drug resistance transporter
MATTSTPTRASVGLRSERGPILLAVMLSTGLVAIDTTILATAVPSVVDDLGGFAQFPWLFSVYVLTTAVTVPIYGKLADLIGRKPVMLIGIGLFLLGSTLCGFAWSMTSLIVFRALQGLGAGAVQPMGMTIMGDIYTLEERAKVQGYIASVWASASLIGPTLGGLFADYASWRWVFFVNLPLGIVAVWMLRRFDERVTRRQTTVDWRGAVLLTVGGVGLLLGLLEGGQQWAWDSSSSIVIFAVAVVAILLFVVVESRASDPVLPLWVYRRRLLNATSLTQLLVGCVMLGLSSYVPLFAQQVLGHGAVAAGLALAGMTIGWPIAASQSGKLYLRFGFRATICLGTVITIIGSLWLLTVDAGTSIWGLGLPCFVMGLGFGLSVSPGVAAVASAVSWEARGVAMGANMFARSVGSAIGVATFGAVANAAVARESGGVVPALDRLPAAVLEPALHTVFVVSACIAVLLLLASLLMPQAHRATRQ